MRQSNDRSDVTAASGRSINKRLENGAQDEVERISQSLPGKARYSTLEGETVAEGI